MQYIPQRTTEWLMQRVGRCTGSQFKHVMARLKNGAPAQARQDYLMQIVCERLTQTPTTSFVTQAMQWGIDNEEAGKQAFIERTGFQVDDVGFVMHQELMAGVSPDGLVNLGESVLEVKCPTTQNHIETILNGMPAQHMPQVQGAMWMTATTHAWFVSYDPRLPKPMSLYVQRIERDPEYIARLEAEVRLFLADVDAVVTTLLEKAQ